MRGGPAGESLNWISNGSPSGRRRKIRPAAFVVATTWSISNVPPHSARPPLGLGPQPFVRLVGPDVVGEQFVGSGVVPVGEQRDEAAGVLVHQRGVERQWRRERAVLEDQFEHVLGELGHRVRR